MRIGVFPGTFDPVTAGHVDIIQRSGKVLDRVVVAVARAYHKDTMFSLEERIELIRESVPCPENLDVIGFDGLLVDLARKQQASVVIRGLRFISDFEYEFQLALMNRRLDPEIETLFFMPSAEYSYLNSSVIKEVARLGGDIQGLVPDPVVRALQGKFES